MSIHLDGDAVNDERGNGMGPRLLHPIPEAVYLTGLSRSKLYEDIATGRLETIKVGSRRLVPHDSLVAYIDRLREVDPSTPAA